MTAPAGSSKSDGRNHSPSKVSCEGSDLVGAAAALKSETGTIGFIRGGEFPVIQRYEAGIVAGAKSVRPDVNIDIVYLSEFGGEAFGDPAISNAAATDMYRTGADVIYAVSGPSPFGNIGVFDAASTESDNLGIHLWAIGVDFDEQQNVLRMFPDQFSSPALQHSPERWTGHILTSAVKPFDEAVYLALEGYSRGDLAAGSQIVAMDYSTSGGFVDEFIPQLDAIKEQINSGEIVVPSVP
ncbi:MAG: BMP family ABC transporter substrate-binding protein [Acidimicrobiia bacterium]